MFPNSLLLNHLFSQMNLRWLFAAKVDTEGSNAIEELGQGSIDDALAVQLANAVRIVIVEDRGARSQGE